MRLWVFATSLVTAGFLTLTMTSPTAADTVVVLVRHAEKMSGMSDPPLSEAGEARAVALAKALKGMRIDHIISTGYKRTLSTAAPVARAFGLEPAILGVDSGFMSHIQSVAEAVRARPDGETILVVGHSNTIPAIVGELGGPDLPELVEANEYATMFVMMISSKGKPRVLRTRYGAPDGSRTRAR